jgi:hemolysin III
VLFGHRFDRPDPLSSTERLADGVVQSVNVVLAAAGCVVLGVLAGTHADPRRLAALIVYGAGLLVMVGASALYAWGRSGHRRRLYRHLDHAAIFLMIAGTYTPFTLISSGGRVHGKRCGKNPLDHWCGEAGLLPLDA